MTDPLFPAAAPAVPADAAPTPRDRARAALRAAPPLAALWWLLNPGDPASWVVGAPAVLIGAGVAAALASPVRWRLSPLGALRFAAFFARGAVLGAVDVARRALAPRPRLAPGLVEARLGLPPGPARVLLANAVTLLPGTLTVELDGDRLLVHALDADARAVRADLARLETRVQGLFALEGPR